MVKTCEKCNKMLTLKPQTKANQPPGAKYTEGRKHAVRAIILKTIGECAVANPQAELSIAHFQNECSSG